MRNHDVLDTELLQNRIMDIEYSEIAKEDIQKIYLEETGKTPPATIEIYHSDDYLEEDERNGFNGTIIHFYDKETGVNQLYTITKGTEMHEKKDWRPADWTYNLMGVFVGENIDQYRSAYKFDNKVTKKIEEKIKKTRLI